MIDEQYYEQMRGNTSERTLLTVCEEADAMWQAYGDRGTIFVVLRTYPEEDYRRIRTQADEWMMRNDYSEFYDYDFYANLGGGQGHSECCELDDRYVLVKDGKFYGAAAYICKPKKMKKGIRYVCAADCVKDIAPIAITFYEYEHQFFWDNIEEPSIITSYYLEKKKPQI